MSRTRTRRNGPLFWNDPLAWTVGKGLDLMESAIRRLVEAALKKLPKPRKRLRR